VWNPKISPLARDTGYTENGLGIGYVKKMVVFERRYGVFRNGYRVLGNQV
jgi:hypothetical protein